MKNSKVLFMSALAISLLVVGCNESETHDPNQDLNKALKVEARPDIGPGESNWLPTQNPSSKLLAVGLTTEDLNTITAQDMVDALIGGGTDAPTISNVVFNGASIAAGTFAGGTGIIGFESGIVLSTGNIASIAGPNDDDNTTTNNGLPGDADLSALIPGLVTNDATVLEFNFECEFIQSIQFEYVFTSEEYNEFVNSQYNDVFAFFLNGENIALVPGTPTPVAINNVNCGNPYSPPSGTNCDLFINNTDGSIDTQMDGLTVVFTATGTLLPGVNKIKLAIADAGDRALDSNVFIKAESFVCAAPVIEVDFDIKPTSCPNPLNVKANGVLPVAILGSLNFDVNDIDLTTLQLEGVPALRSDIEDVTGPVSDSEDDCECTTDGPDGFEDLTIKFDNRAIASALGVVIDGEQVQLNITGALKDGTPISGIDCVLIIQKKGN